MSALLGLGRHEYDLADEQAEALPVTFDWAPGTPTTGLSGPPENYDPGEGDEFVIVSPPDLSCNAEDRIIEYLDANWERPADEPDPDWLRDERMDAAL